VRAIDPPHRLLRVQVGHRHRLRDMRLQYRPIVLADVVGAQTVANARRPLDTHPLASD
ncbi:uncharacterized protein METZ01_LOCUS346441, partial [marine metagenome]